jgi:hypothetical protein
MRIALVVALSSLTLIAFIGPDVRADDRPDSESANLPGQPVPPHLLQSLPDYVQLSSPRLITYPNGNQEIIFDREAAQARTYDLPFCEPREPGAPRRDPTREDLDKATREGAKCRAMADRIAIGPPSLPGSVGP